MRPLEWVDDHPVLATCSLAFVIFVGLRCWSFAHDGPVLLAGAEPEQRVTIYGQLAGTAVATMAIALTVLALLLALPDRPAVRDIRNSDTWPRLRGLLLTVALLALLSLLAAHLGAAVDNAKVGREWLEQILLSTAVAAVVALIFAGITFWLVLDRADDPDDPSRGRGAGSSHRS